MVALVRQEKEKMSSAATCLSLRPPYLASIAMKPYPVGYTMPNFQRFNGLKEIPQSTSLDLSMRWDRLLMILNYVPGNSQSPSPIVPMLGT